MSLHPPSYNDAIFGKVSSQNRPPMEEIQLWDSREERNKITEFADLFAIMRATEALEIAYCRGVISHSDYQRECSALIRQFQMNEKALRDKRWIADIESFIRSYDIQCSRAYQRLVKEQIPVMVERDDRGSAAAVLEATQAFINAKDALQLNQRAVDVLQPFVMDIMTALRRMTSYGLPVDFIGIVKIQQWLLRFNQMKAHDDLEEDDSRQLTHDLETSYSAFRDHLNNTN